MALEIVRRAHRLGFDNFWMQPGSESPEALAYLEKHGLGYLAGACIMVHSRAVA